VRYNDLMSPMVKAIQELNDSLKVQVQSLKLENEQQQTTNDKLQTALSVQQKEIEKLKQKFCIEAKK